jgi:cell wall-associated NlpC family hydrolase
MKTSEIKQGDLLFLSGKGIIETIIQWVTRSKFYHVAVFINDHELIEAQGGEKTSIVPLSKYLNSKDNLYVYRDVTLTDYERYKIANYALSHQGIEYNYMSILAELLRYEMHILIENYNEGNKRICSSFVNDCFKSIGKKLSEQKVPSPQDIVEGKVLTRIGKLKK